MGYTTGRKPWRSEPWRREEYNTDVEANFAVKQRIYFFGLAIFFLFGVLALQLARMQLVNGNKYRQGQRPTGCVRCRSCPPAA